MKYKFRLVFFHSRPGFFRIDSESIDYPLNEELVIQIVPRDSDNLLNASKYHIECGGFPAYQDAKNFIVPTLCVTAIKLSNFCNNKPI